MLNVVMLSVVALRLRLTNSFVINFSNVRPHDSYHKDIQHNDTQHKGLICYEASVLNVLPQLTYYTSNIFTKLAVNLQPFTIFYHFTTMPPPLTYYTSYTTCCKFILFTIF